MESNYLKVKDYPDLVRDKNSKGIININNEALKQYKTERDQKMKLSRMLEKSDNLYEDVEMLKNDMKDIKSLLTEIIGKL
jgi:hypothetical protein